MTHLTSRKQHCCGNSLLGDGIVQGKSFAMALLRESMFCDGIAQGNYVLLWHCSGKVCFLMALLSDGIAHLSVPENGMMRRVGSHLTLQLQILPLSHTAAPLPLVNPGDFHIRSI